jgi:hypothetical protein
MNDTAGELVCQAQNGVVFALNMSTLFDFASKLRHRILCAALAGSGQVSLVEQP